MASEDQTKEKAFVIAPLQWGSLLSAVKDQIPTMDSDASVSDGEEGEEDLFIFQRDEPNLIPDLTEVLEDSPPEESYLQKTYAFMRNPKEIWNEDPGSPNSAASPVFLGQGGFGFLTEKWSSQDAASPSEATMTEKKPGEGISGIPPEGQDIKEEKGRLGSSPDTPPSVPRSPSAMLNASAKERRRLIETTILSKAIVGPLAKEAHPVPEPQNANNNTERRPKTGRGLGTTPADRPQEPTLLAFQDIEQLDLDKVLQDLQKQSGDTSWTLEMAFPSVNPALESTRNLSHASLMGKLEALALDQSRAFRSQRERCLAKFPEFSKCQGDGKGVPGLWNNWSLTPAELHWVPEPPTVYMDLRGATPQRPEVTRDEKLSSSDSSSDDEEDTEGRGPEERGTKTDAFPRPSRDCTGKSFLLQQLRLFRGRTAPLASATGETIPRLQSPEGTDLPGARRSRRLREGRLASVAVKDAELSAKSIGQNPNELKRGAEGEPGTGSPLEASETNGACDSRRKGSQEEKQGEEKTKKQQLREMLEK